MENKEMLTPEEVKEIARKNTENMSVEELNRIKNKLISNEEKIRERAYKAGFAFANQIAAEKPINMNIENQAHAYIEAFNLGLQDGLNNFSKEENFAQDIRTK